MKLGRIMFALVICLMVIGSVCRLAQADDNKVEIEVTAEVVSSPPSVTTNDPIVFTSFAILYGRLDSLGAAKTVRVYFEWGKTTDYGSMTRMRTMRHSRPFVAIIRGLSPDTTYTTYHFRAVAVGDGTSYGEDMSFTTRGRWWWKWRRYWGSSG